MKLSPFAIAKKLSVVGSVTAEYLTLLENDDSSEEQLIQVLLRMRSCSEDALNVLGMGGNVATPTPKPKPAPAAAQQDVSPVSFQPPEPVATYQEPTSSPTYVGEDVNPFAGLEFFTSPKEEEPDTRVAKKGAIHVYLEGEEDVMVLDPGISPNIISEVMMRDFVKGTLKSKFGLVTNINLVNADDNTHILISWSKE